MHASLGDTSLGVHLLQDSVDVHREGFSSSLLLFVVASFSCSFLSGVFGSGGSFSGSSGFLGGHLIVCLNVIIVERGELLIYRGGMCEDPEFKLICDFIG